MVDIVIYCSGFCPYCERARALLERKGVTFEEVRIDQEPKRRAEMEERAGGRTSVPQIFFGDRHIGGFDDMAALENAGELDALLK
jgi:glutaredoxin 3